MKKTKLLISGVGGSLFPYLIDKLTDKYDLYLIDSNPLMKKVYKDENIFILPLVLDSSYEQEVVKIIKKYKIDFYIPLIDEEIIKAIDISEQIDVKTLCPSREFVSLSLDKYKLMQKLHETSISDITTIMADKFVYGSVKYPIFLKPNVGRGSRGIKQINTNEEFEAYFILEEYSKEDVLVQPYINGEEYTVSVTVNNLNKIISIIPKIVYTKEGITKHAKSVRHDSIEKVCKKIVEILEPKGSFNVQLKEYEDNIYIFEINPRFSTTLVLSIESGVNEVDLNIKFYDKQDVEYIEFFQETTLIRRWENLFLSGEKNV